MVTDLTPMMRQYLAIKEQNKDAILFFRLGDFYEMFFDDAKEASKLLQITLTARAGGNKRKVPMCGVPHHAANGYISKLLRHGRKVAICDQVEKPEPGKKIVKRDVVKIITPGTFIDEDHLDEGINKYTLSIKQDGDTFGLAYADISTGEFFVTEISGKESFFSELYKISPAECLIPEDFLEKPVFDEFEQVNPGTITINENWHFDYGLSLKEIENHFSVKSLEGFGCHDLEIAVGAAGALLKYLKNTQKAKLENIDGISTYFTSQFLVMDSNTQRNLELTNNLEDLTIRGTLLGVMDNTQTPMGKRMLKKWILSPLLDVVKIQKRLDAVQYFYDNNMCRNSVRDTLKLIFDVERLSNRVNLGIANARDMVALSSSLKSINALRKGFSGEMPDSLKEIVSSLESFNDVMGKIDACLVESPPHSIKDGGVIKDGFDPEVDELKGLVSNGRDWVASLKKKEIERTGINSLKVGYNKVFGYYIEVTTSNLDQVPADYIRKQTLVNAERFITPELKEKEAKIIGAQERVKELEYEHFCVLRENIGKEIERLKKVSDRIAKIDVLSSNAETAILNHYSKPKVNNTDRLNINDGRHPVLEKILSDKEFVPNDVALNSESDRIFVITGSNMAGKSTFIRQVALIVIMAQTGSFVPAKDAEVGLIDRIFTRVGASDRLYRGMSTFMVEMLETSNILHNATDRSLLILDEIGRGTSTFDGVSIAWAVVEYIHHKLSGTKAMFATHYHELTELSEILNGIKNYHLAVQEWGDDIVFLYKVKEGNCDESFGVHVAKLAGMPSSVVKRAHEILANLQKDSLLGNIKSRFVDKKTSKEKQLDLFESSDIDHPVVSELDKLNVDNMTPLEALQKLVDMKKEIDNNK